MNSAADILGDLTQKSGLPLDEEAIREDIKTIFSSGNVFDVQVEFNDENVLIYKITEYPANVEFEIKGEMPKGLSLFDYIPYRYFHRMFALSFLKQNATLQELKNTDVEVQENLRRLGYMNASVEAEVTVVYNEDEKYRSKIMVTYQISAGHKYIVSDVSFYGNKEFSTNTLSDLFVTRKVQTKRMKRKYGHFSQNTLDSDIISLKARYVKEGFFDVDVDPLDISFNEDNHSVAISVNIVEGSRYIVDSVSCEPECPSTLKTTGGEFYNAKAVEADVLEMGDYFQNQGYANISVIPDMKTDKASKRVSLVFKIDKGELFYFGEITKKFKEVKRIPSDSLIAFKTGDLYSKEKIERTKKNLENTQNLEEVRITTEITAERNVLDVTIQSSFRDIISGRFMANASLEKPYWVYHRGVVNNWLGYRNIIETQYRLFDNERTFALGVSRFFSRGTGLSLSAFDSDYQWPLQTYQKLGGALQVSQRFTKSLHGAVVYTLYQNRSKLSSALLPVSLDGDGRRATLLAGLTFDSRDYSPRGVLESSGGFVGKGWYLSAQGELDAAWLGSTQELAGLHLRAARFFTLKDGGRQPNVPGGITLKLLGRYDRRWSRSDAEIPYTERFLLGGIGAVRGFRLQGLGTQIEESGRQFHIGGDHAYSGTVEVELPFFDEFFADEWRRLRWALFVDAGEAFDSAVSGFRVVPEAKDFGRLPVRTSAGLSLRWYVSFLSGPMRFDLARPLDARSGEGFQANFSISTEL